MRKTNTTLRLTQLGVLTAIVVVLQVLAIVTRPLFPVFSITLVLIPITVGAALLGVPAGGWLGLAFGAAVLISGDAAPFLAVNFPATIFVVLAKGLLAGLAAGAIYKAFENKNKTLAAVFAGIVCPIVNTGVFVIGCYAFFLPTIKEWAAGAEAAAAGLELTAEELAVAAESSDVTAFIFLGMIGVNFLVELGINLVLIPVIVRIIKIGKTGTDRQV